MKCVMPGVMSAEIAMQKYTLFVHPALQLSDAVLHEDRL